MPSFLVVPPLAPKPKKKVVVDPKIAAELKVYESNLKTFSGSDIYSNKYSKTKKKTTKKPKVDTSAESTNEGDKTPPPTQPTPDYKWNLPPHKWSLPLQPEVINQGFSNATGLSDQYRRGRMWWYESSTQKFTEPDGKGGKKTRELDRDNRKYGFQFLWNPDSFSTSVSLNTSITPTPLDRFTAGPGFFPSGESITFTLRLDRTNDFAAYRALLNRDYKNLNAATPATVDNSYGAFREGTSNLDYKPPFSPTSDFRSFIALASEYKIGFNTDATAEDIALKIKSLLERGTLADLEYLYMAINGGPWKNAAGQPTSDIGFLSATLLRLDIGPSAYVGFVNSLNVSHTAFNQDMTPIRTDVSISMNLMASAGLEKLQEETGN